MDSDSVTHITDSTQNEMPIERATSHSSLEHRLGGPELPRYPNTQQTDGLPRVTDTNRSHRGRHRTHVQQTCTTLAEAGGGSKGGSRLEELQSDLSGPSNDEVNIDRSGGNTSRRQRLTNYPTLLDFYLETSVGIGSHLDISTETHFPGDMLSNETGNMLTTGPTDHLPTRRRTGRGVFADSLIHLFESTTVLYYCTFCNFISPSYWLWRKHEREQHLLSDNTVVDTSTQDLKCYFCDVDAANINERAEHIARHFFWQGLTKADWDAHRADKLSSQPS